MKNVITSSIGWSDLVQNIFKMFVIARGKFLRKKILGKSNRKVENLNGKKFNSGAICPEKNELNNKKFSFRLKL